MEQEDDLRAVNPHGWETNKKEWTKATLQYEAGTW